MKASSLQLSPGPWNLGEGGENIMGVNISRTILDANGFEVASLPDRAILDDYSEKTGFDHWADGGNGVTYQDRPSEELDANQNLILAAPDLLAACEIAHKLLREYGASCACGYGVDLRVELGRAIAKANGREFDKVEAT